MQITVVTSNQGKFIEIKDILSKYNIRASQSIFDTKEEGTTLEERCLSKAKHAYSVLKKPLIVDDSGLFFKAFDNFPGPFPKKVFTELGFDGIMKKIEGKNREAYFKAMVCYIDQKSHNLFSGIVNGKISEKVYDGGHESLPYDRIFIPEGHRVPFCKISDLEKNKISHRAKAVEKFAKWMLEEKAL